MKNKLTAALLAIIMVLGISVSAIVPVAACNTAVSVSNGNQNGNGNNGNNGNGNQNGNGNNGNNDNGNKDYDNTLLAMAIVSAANFSIEALVHAYQNMPNPNIKELIKQTNSIAKQAIKECAKLKITVKCEYRTYMIDGKSVEIDPLRVVG